jgi:uncharacterized protein (TIGR02145 family)
MNSKFILVITSLLLGVEFIQAQLEFDTSNASLFSVEQSCSGEITAQLNLGAIEEILNDYISSEFLQNPAWEQIANFEDRLYFQWQGENKNWQNSEALCQSVGGHLMCIETAEENEAVVVPIASTINFWDVWLGLYQDTNDPGYYEPVGAWKWISGEPLVYTNWGQGEPSGGGENHASVDWNNIADRWNDIYGAYTMGIVLELDTSITLSWSTGEEGPNILMNEWPVDGLTLSIGVFHETYTISIPAPVAPINCSCSDPLACNYDSNEENWGTYCIYPVVGEDCFDGASICADGTWWHPGEQRCYPHPCLGCPGDFNADHLISITDLLGLLGQFGETCEPAGCSDEHACNFNPIVLIDDGSCVYGSVDSCGCLTDCQGNLIGDLDGDGICDNATSTGCGDSLACNYSSDLCLTNPALCIYGDLEPGSPCDDGDPDTFNDVADASGCNCAGTPAVAEDGSGSCEGLGTLSYQGYEYQLVEIGDQCWFAENLRGASYRNGDAIASNLNNSEWSSTTSGATAVNGESASNLEIYGRLYNRYAVDDARGLCPSGWHVPTDGEWMAMEITLGMSGSEANGTGWRGTDQGTQMKANYGWGESGNGANSSGFSGLPGGLRYISGSFGNPGIDGGWWSSSPVGSNAWLRQLAGVSGKVNRYNDYPRVGWSVRCVRDAE